MANNVKRVAQELFDKIRSRFEKISIGDEKSDTTQDPEDARFFNFNYTSTDGTDFGNVTISIVNETDLKIYFSKNITEKLNDDQKQEWYTFLRNMRMFAKRHLLSFDTRDISRGNLSKKDIRQVSNDTTFHIDDITESKGLSKKVRIIKGPADVVGKVGTVSEVRPGKVKGAEKTYTIDYTATNGSIQSVQLPASHIRLVKDVVDSTINEDKALFSWKRRMERRGANDFDNKEDDDGFKDQYVIAKKDGQEIGKFDLTVDREVSMQESKLYTPNDFVITETSHDEIGKYLKQHLIETTGRCNMMHLPGITLFLNHAQHRNLIESHNPGIQDFISALHRLDQRKNVNIKIGQSISIVRALISPYDDNNIIIDGNITPKRIINIDYSADDKINFVEFDDHTTFPDKLQLSRGQGSLETFTTMFYPTKQAAEHALTMIALAVPKGWKITTGMMTESKLYGSKKKSYQNIGKGKTKIIIKHDTKVDDSKHGARSRHISEVFIENIDGERFKVPFTHLPGCRAMARHIAEGGKIYDEFGDHITDLVKKQAELRKIVRKSRKNTLENIDGANVASTLDEYAQIQETIGKIKGPRGYKEYKTTMETKLNEESVGDSKMSAISHISAKFGPLMQRLAKMHNVSLHYDDNTKKWFVDKSIGVEPFINDVLYMTAPKGSALTGSLSESNGQNEIDANNEIDRSIADFNNRVKEMENNHELKVLKPGMWKFSMNELVSKRDALVREKAKMKEYYNMNKVTENGNHMPELAEFENWADEASQINEGTWAIADTDEEINELRDLLSKELPVGVDATNATSALYNLVGDDGLFDLLGEIADEDTETNTAPIVRYWIDNHMPDLFDRLYPDGYEEKDAGDDNEEPAPKEDSPEISDIKRLSGIK